MADDYAAIAAINWSTLKHMRMSPKHYRYALDNPDVDSLAKAIGRAVHVAVLQPEKLDETYYVYPGDRRGKRWDEFRRAHSDREILREKEWEQVKTVAAAVHADPTARIFLEGEFVEQTFQWEDQETGLPCKCRVDAVAGSLVEFKTTASLRWFPRDVTNYGYDCQIAFYSDALEANGVQARPPRLIAVEKAPPYDVVVYRIKEDQLERARAEYRKLLHRVKECQESGEWPGVGEGKQADLYLRDRAETQPITLGGVEAF